MGQAAKQSSREDQLSDMVRKACDVGRTFDLQSLEVWVSKDADL